MSDTGMSGKTIHTGQCQRCGVVMAAWTPPGQGEDLPRPDQWECDCPVCNYGWIKWGTSGPVENGIRTGYPEPAANGADLTHNLRAAARALALILDAEGVRDE